MNIALAILVIFFAASLGLGLWSRRGKEMDMEGWSVGGRNLGAIIVFLLLAGEIYTTFTFLGGSGYAYGHGGPVYYILCYATLAYVMSYFMLPPIWRYARDHALYSQADFFASKYDSQMLGVLVSLVGMSR